MPRSKYRSCRSLRFLASTSVIACTIAVMPVAIDLQLKEPILKTAQADKSCFVAGTRILMADGSEKRIEQVAVGDLVVGGHGAVNRVTGIERPSLGRRRLYALNGGLPFVTADHPFLTRSGWKAIDPAASAAENGALEVGTLIRGDLLAVARSGTAWLADGNLAALQTPALALGFELLARIESVSADPRTELFNLLLDGDHSYFADGYLVHNKDGGDSSGPGGGGSSGEGSGNSGSGSGESSDDSGHGSGSGESGEEGESGKENEPAEDKAISKSRDSSVSASGFGGLEQLGPNLTPSEEAETIQRGWQ